MLNDIYLRSRDIHDQSLIKLPKMHQMLDVFAPSKFYSAYIFDVILKLHAFPIAWQSFAALSNGLRDQGDLMLKKHQQQNRTVCDYVTS